MKRSATPNSIQPDDIPAGDLPEEEMFSAPPRGRWKRRLKVLVVLVLLGVIAAEVGLSLLISSRLRGTVSAKLDAELKLGPLIYLPPYGAIVFNPQLTRGSETIFRAARIKLALAKFPRKNEAVVIASLKMTSPVLSLAPGQFDHISKPSGQAMAPRKLSEMLQLDDVRLFDGKIQYREKGSEPMSWEGLSLDADTTQQSPSKYTFHVISRAQLTADVSLAGEMDVDTLEVKVRNMSMKVRVEPEPTRATLPAKIQRWFKDYGVNGNLAIIASGTIPIRNPQLAAFHATISLDNAVAELSKLRLSLDRATADLVVDKAAGKPIIARVQTADFASGGKSLSLKRGQIAIDTAAQRWSVTDLDGTVQIDKPRLETPSVFSTPTTVPTAKWEKFQPAGRADFTAMASGPFKITGSALEAIDHQIILYPRNASFLPKDFAHRVEDIGGGEIRIKGGMIIFQELDAKYGGDTIRLRSARLPIAGLPQLSQWQEISAAVHFHQPIRRYIPKLDKIFDAINPDGVFLIAGSWTLDKRAAESKSTYELIISTDRGSFDLTSHHIPLQNIRGDATLTPAGLQLHGIEAKLLNGKATMTGNWYRNSESSSNFEGDLTLNNVDLARLADVSDNPPNINMKGRLSSQMTFSGTTVSGQPNLAWTKQLHASGEMEILGGDFFKLPVFKDIFEHIKPLNKAADAGDAAAVFDIADEQLLLRDAAVNAPVLGIQGSAKLGFNGQIDAGVVAAPLADWRDKLRETKIPIVSDVAGEIAGAVQKLLNTATGTLVYQFRVTGNVHGRMEIVPIPAPILTDAAATVFGRMVSPKKPAHPLELFENSKPPKSR